MYEILAQNPWLLVLVIAAVVIIACTAIVFITEYLRKTHQAEIDGVLKRELVARGLSAADIKTILEATGDAEQRALATSDDGFRIALGKFRLEAGSMQNQPQDLGQSSPASS